MVLAGVLTAALHSACILNMHMHMQQPRPCRGTGQLHGPPRAAEQAHGQRQPLSQGLTGPALHCCTMPRQACGLRPSVTGFEAFREPSSATRMYTRPAPPAAMACAAARRCVSRPVLLNLGKIRLAQHSSAMLRQAAADAPPTCGLPRQAQQMAQHSRHLARCRAEQQQLRTDDVTLGRLQAGIGNALPVWHAHGLHASTRLLHSRGEDPAVGHDLGAQATPLGGGQEADAGE